MNLTDTEMDKIVDTAIDQMYGRYFEFIEKYNDLNPNDFLPRRSTEHSAGYDFIAIKEQVIPSKQIKIITTGIKVKLPKNEYLELANRSSNPKKRGLILINGVGIVDSDYYNNEENEGEIGFMFYNMKDEDVTIHVGDKIGQGIFKEYKLATNDLTEHKARTGGFGSTGA